MKKYKACVVCGKPKLVFKDKFWLCLSCKYQKAPGVNKKELQEYYNKSDLGLQVQNILEKKISSSLRIYHKKGLEMLRKKVTLFKNRTVCDIGCGVGSFLLEAKKRGMKVYGYDINKQQTSIARIKYHLSHVVAAEKLDEFCKKDKIQKHFFDVITAFEVIEHVPDVNAFVKDMSFYLRKGGYVIISCPNSDRLSLHERWDYPPIHLSRFNKTSMQKLFEKYGFFMKEWVSYSELGYYSNNIIHNINATQTVLQDIISQPDTSVQAKQNILQIIVSVKKIICKMIDIPLYVFLLTQKKRGHTMVFIAQKI